MGETHASEPKISAVVLLRYYLALYCKALRYDVLGHHNPQWKFYGVKILPGILVLAIDHLHKEANALIKGYGGAIGVTEDASVLRRWMFAGHEVSWLVAEYELASGAKEAIKNTSHH